MTRAWLFDMDGVVVDSNGYHREAWVAHNRNHGVATTEAMLEGMYGKRNDEIVRDFFGSHLSDQEAFAHGAAKEALFREMIAPQLKAKLVPGIVEFLQQHQDLAIALVTNAEAANAKFVLDQTGLRQYFRIVVDGQQVTHAKPHPEIYLRAAELLRVSPSECLVFEDSYAGVAAGLAAGMPVIGIRTTHEDLPGTVLTASDFHDTALTAYLQAH